MPDTPLYALPHVTKWCWFQSTQITAQLYLATQYIVQELVLRLEDISSHVMHVVGVMHLFLGGGGPWQDNAAQMLEIQLNDNLPSHILPPTSTIRCFYYGQKFLLRSNSITSKAFWLNNIFSPYLSNTHIWEVCYPRTHPGVGDIGIFSKSFISKIYLIHLPSLYLSLHPLKSIWA